ncbi:hypothetical protein LTR12_015613 [Friedmanniomyces endolithicus]|nr:hypothetical protein LTR12_015613 [Friedmanniomyces endolithicus]
MAPDLNAVAAGERFDYSQPGSSGYNINPDTTFNDPSNRKLRVLTIGAGVTGILMAYRIQKDCPNVEHVIYEKNEDIGGTWLENRYPGAACDIPSHALAALLLILAGYLEVPDTSNVQWKPLIATLHYVSDTREMEAVLLPASPHRVVLYG